MMLGIRILFAFSVLVSIQASAVLDQHQHQIKNVASHAFHSMASTSPSSSIPGISASCESSSEALEANPMVIAANASVIIGGCTKFNTKDNTQCTTSIDRTNMQASLNCNCVATFQNTDYLYGNVTALGGRVCPLSISMTMTFTGTVDGKTFTFFANMKQNSQNLGIIGSGCTDQDIQAGLEFATQQGMDTLKSLGTGQQDFKLKYLSATTQMCGVNATRVGAARINGVSWLVLVAAICVSFITRA